MASTPVRLERGRPDRSREVESLVTQWHGVIVRAARQYGLDAGEQDELTQDLRLRFWNLLERSGASAPTINASYAQRAAMSAAVDLVRRHRLRRDLPQEEVPESLSGGIADEDDLPRRLARALEAVIPSRRVAVRLHLDGRSLREVASLLRWTEAQARNQLYRGLADLKAHLREDS